MIASPDESVCTEDVSEISAEVCTEDVADLNAESNHDSWHKLDSMCKAKDTAKSTFSVKTLRTSWTKYVMAVAFCYNGSILSWELAVGIDRDVMNIGNGVFFLVTCLGSLVSSVIVERLGPRRSTTLGCMLMAGFTAGAGLVLGTNDTSWQWLFYITGNVCCALACALIGAAFGPMLDRTSRLLCQIQKESPEACGGTLDAELVGESSIIHNVIGIVIVVVGAVCVNLKLVSNAICAGSTTVLTLAAAVLVSTCENLPPLEPETTILSNFRALARFYREPRAWLLFPCTLAVGGMSAWHNSTIIYSVQDNLGSFGIIICGLIENLVVIVAMTICRRRSSRRYTILTLATAGMLLGICLFYFTNLAESGWWAAVFYVLSGCSYAAYDIAVKPTVSEHFRGDQAAPAFSSLTLQWCLMKALLYFGIELMGDDGTAGDVLAGIVGFFALLIVPGTFAADRRLQREKAKADKAANLNMCL